MRSSTFLSAMACICALANVASAHGEPLQTTMPAADRSSIERLASEFFSKLEAGQARPAIDGFFSGNSLIAGKDTNLELLANQMELALRTLGPITHCDIVERENLGTLAERQLFLCQHQKALSRWKVTFIRVPAGWIGAAVIFDDKLFAGMD